MDSLSPSHPNSAATNSWLIFSALSFGFSVFLILPAGVAVLNDDFGYLRSVVETLQHGRPWTDNWLEPWAASSSLLTALLYRVTGSFQFATQGFLALLAALSFRAACALFEARGNSPRISIVSSALLLTFPTLLWKATEFTSVALYLPCLLLALHAAEKGKWAWFFLWWGLAIAARQSAITWAIFPVMEILNRSRAGRDRCLSIWFPTLALLAGLALFLGLALSMNKSHAQTVVTDHLLERRSAPAAMRACCLGFLVYIWAAGLSGWLVRVRTVDASQRNIGRAFAAWIVVLLLLTMSMEWINFEHRLFASPLGLFYGWFIILLGAAGWWKGGFRLLLGPAVVAAGSVALLCVRQEIWDYYLLDIVLLGFFGTTGLQSIERIGPRVSSSRIRPWLLGTLAAFHGLFVLDLKCTLDRGYALCSLAETAMRQGLLRPAELSFAPFGFAGWHLHRHYLAHEGAASAQLDGFNGYLVPGAVEVGQSYSRPLHIFPRFRHEPPGDRHNLILSGRYRFAWVFHAEFFLLRFKDENDARPALPLQANAYRIERFPLNDGEWRELIEKTRSIREI